MSVKKQDICVDCGHCRYAQAGQQPGSFDVVVPVRDIASGVEGLARLQCRVTPERHEVRLVDWRGMDERPLEPPPGLRDRLDEALAWVAEHRVCGNQQICPAEVVRIVQEHAAAEPPERAQGGGRVGVR